MAFLLIDEPVGRDPYVDEVLNHLHHKSHLKLEKDNKAEDGNGMCDD